MSVAGRAARDLAQEDAARGLALGHFCERLAVDFLVADQDVHAFDRNGQQFLVFDLGRARSEDVDEHIAGAGHRDDIALTQDGVGTCLLDLSAAADAQNEDAGVGHERLGLDRTQADRPLHRLRRGRRELPSGARPSRLRRLPCCRRPAFPRSPCRPLRD
jgi:hypothetical protein